MVAYLECRWNNKVDGRYYLDDRIERTRSCGGERRWRGIHLQPYIPLISFILLFYYDWLKSNNYLLFRVLHQSGLVASLCSILGKMLLNVSVLRLFPVQPMLSSCTGNKLLHSSLLFLCFGSSRHRLCYQAVPVLNLLHTSLLFLCFGSSRHRLCYQAVPVLSLLHSSVTC